MRNYQHALPEV